MHRIAAIAALSAICLSGCLGDPRKHLEKGRDLTFQRQPAEALREYEEVLSLLHKKDARRVQAILIPALKGAGDLCYLELKNFPKAIEYYQALASKFPNAPETLEARANLSDLYRLLGDRRLAVAELAALIQGFPESPDADQYQYLAAKDYFDLGDYDQAIVEARVLQDRYPKSQRIGDSQMLIGAAWLLQGQRDKAIATYQELVQRWPDSEYVARAQFEEARILADQEKEEQAVELLVKALETHPDPKSLQLEISRLRKRIALKRAPSGKRESFPEWYQPR